MKHEYWQQVISERAQIGRKGAADMSDSFLTQSEDLTQKLAYEYWVRRGRPFGSPEVDWFAAKQHLAAQHEVEDGNLSLYAFPMEPTES